MSPLSLCRFCVPLYLLSISITVNIMLISLLISKHISTSLLMTNIKSTKNTTGQKDNRDNRRQHGIKIRMIFCLSFVFIGQFNHYIISSYSLFFHRSIHLLFNAKFFASNKNYSKKLKYFCLFSEEITIKKISKKSQKISKNRNLHFNFSKNLLKTFPYWNN